MSAISMCIKMKALQWDNRFDDDVRVTSYFYVYTSEDAFGDLLCKQGYTHNSQMPFI